MKTRIRALFVSLPLLLIAVSAGWAGQWSIDFENEWTASSGDLAIIGNNPADAYDRTQFVHLRTHSSRPDNIEARIGFCAPGNPSSLRYENLDSSIFSGSGSATFDLRVGVAGYPTSMAAFFAADRGPGSSNYILFGMSKPHRFILRTHSYDGVKPWERQYIYDMPAGLEAGWHTLEFKWTEAVPYAPSDPNGGVPTSVRQQVDVEMYIDDELVWSDEDVFWARPIQTSIELGGLQTGSGFFYPLGMHAIMMDNVTVKGIPGSCGAAGTVYYPGDVNQDCYVNLLDLSQLAAAWLDCSDAANPACAAP